jgi:hypothetical protein
MKYLNVTIKYLKNNQIPKHNNKIPRHNNPVHSVVKQTTLMSGPCRGGPGSIPLQSVWDFYLKRWNCGRVFARELFVFLIQYHSISFQRRSILIHLPPTL